MITLKRELPPSPQLIFVNQANLEVQSVDKGVGRLKLVVKRNHALGVCLDRLVEFIDIALSIDRALVSSTHREGM